MADTHIERLGQLPRRADHTWQGGRLGVPSGVYRGADGPQHLRLAIWVDDKAEKSYIRPGQQKPTCTMDEALDALVEMACGPEGTGFRPGRIEVREKALAVFLLAALSDLDIEVVHVEHLEGLFGAFDGIIEAHFGERPFPSALAGEGVTAARLRAFAEAAAAFWRAAPWEHLTDEDLIAVESPDAPPGCRFTIVLGKGGGTYGLGFYHREDEYWGQYGAEDPQRQLRSRVGGAWMVSLDPIDEMIPADAILWEDLDLPVADERAYPQALCFATAHKPTRRPGAARLAFFEGLLRALAATSEAQIDDGRWDCRVPTADGDVEFHLALPHLLEPPSRQQLFRHGVPADRRGMERVMAQMQWQLEAEPPADEQDLNRVMAARFIGRPVEEFAIEPNDPAQRAQDLCYQAFEARGRRQLQLVRRVLEISPDCPDAYVILAERESDPGRALSLYEQGVAAGERTLGPAIFQEEGGFWDDIATRPYMRARLGMAVSLAVVGRVDEAVEHLQALLRLNPDDNQGVRHILLPLLLGQDRNADARRLLDGFDGEPSLLWLYARVLLAFREHGDDRVSLTALRAAIREEPAVAELLLDPDAPPEASDLVDPAGARDALFAARVLGPVWEKTPGAIEWLRGRRYAAESRVRRPRRRRRGKRRR